MLVARKSMLQSELEALQSMVRFNERSEGQANETLAQLNTKLNQSTEVRENKTDAAATTMRDCMSENSQQNSSSTSGGSTACDKFKDANSDAVSATFQQAQVKLEYESAAFLLNSKGQFNDFLSMRSDSLKRQIQSIDADIDRSEAYLGGVADSRDFQNLNSVLNETEQNLDDAWTAFEYDSDSSHIHSEEETKSVNVAAGIGIGVGEPGFGGQASANYGKSTADLKQALNSANLKVSGELLRVVIKRPWFKPDIFTDPSLSFVSYSHAGRVELHG
jgi:hypothetical protein